MDTNANTPVFGTFESGGVTIDLDAVPLKVQVALMQRTIAHKFGNEVAAAVGKQREKDGKQGDEFDDDYQPLFIKLREEMREKLLNGTIGLRISGPRGDTIENIAFELAMRKAEATLAPKGYWPKADRKAGIKAEEATVEFAGQHLNREELADMVLAKYKDQLMEEAKEEHAKRMEKAKLAKANAVKAVSTVTESIDALL